MTAHPAALIGAVATFAAAVALAVLAARMARRRPPRHPDDAWGDDQW